VCTVTYLPLSTSSFILTHNRDEHHTRTIATLPEKRIVHGKEIVFPKDEQGGGTWFASGKKFTICLLNGGFEKHIRKPSYRHSRGLVIPDFFKWENIDRFIHEYDFEDLEPFTLIILEHANQQVHEIVSDEIRVTYTIMDDSLPAIWSSTTLYTDHDRDKRRIWFEQWNREHPTDSQKDIIDFHMSQQDEAANEGIRINRDSILFTVSLTSVLKDESNKVSLYYEDLLRHKKKIIVI